MTKNGEVLFVTIPLGKYKLELNHKDNFDYWYLKTKSNQVLDIYCVNILLKEFQLKDITHSEYFDQVKAKLTEYYNSLS